MDRRMNSKQRRHERRKDLKNSKDHTDADSKDQTQSAAKMTDKKGTHKKPSLPTDRTEPAWRIAKRTSKIVGKVILDLGFVLGVVTGYLALLPRVSVSQNDQLDPDNAFSSPFIVTNDGPLPMESVRFTCGIVDVKHQNGPEVVGDANFGTHFFMLKDKDGKIATQNFGSPEMMPGERSTLPSCSYPYLNPVENANIGIVVDFRVGYTFFPARRVFRFATLKDNNGKIHWFPFPVK